ncbi:hypothetical protein AHAS_Ahas04G0134200 [Arachis hypogaea]
MASEIKIMRKEEDETALHAPLDRLSYLPNELLTMVISSLSIAKAARTSTLTKSWRGLWRHAACLEFDETTMPRPSILPERQLGTSSLYGTIIGMVFNGYVGDLRSVSFKHFHRSIDVGELEFWVDFVLNKFKKINSLSLKCERLVVEPKPPFFPKGSRIVKLNFRLMKLKILKLKNMRMSDGAINGVLCKCLGLESLSIVESKGFKTLEINDPWLKFLELGWLIVNEVDLSVKGLETLVEEDECSASANNSYDNVCLPFSTSMFWERNNLYNCINHTLKFATIKGFTGKEQEVNFIEHVIKNATMIKRLP